MERVISYTHCKEPDGTRRPSGPIVRWTILVLCLYVIWLFVFVFAPAFEKSEMIKPLTDYVRESGIDAGALYYTEVEETSEAELYLRHALDTDNE